MDFYEAKALETLTTKRAKCEGGGSVFESASATPSNTEASNSNKDNLVAPRGFDTFAPRALAGVIMVA